MQGRNRQVHDRPGEGNANSVGGRRLEHERPEIVTHSNNYASRPVHAQERIVDPFTWSIHRDPSGGFREELERRWVNYNPINDLRWTLQGLEVPEASVHGEEKKGDERGW